MILFFFNDTATTEIYTLSLHDALPISPETSSLPSSRAAAPPGAWKPKQATLEVWSSDDSALAQVLQDCLAENRDRKSTRLNSSHLVISYAVFCLKKKNQRNRLVDTVSP